MPAPARTTEPTGDDPAGMVMPEGTPAWVTAELIHATLRVWQRFYSNPLSVDDAVTILLITGRLFAALSREEPP